MWKMQYILSIKCKNSTLVLLSKYGDSIKMNTRSGTCLRTYYKCQDNNVHFRLFNDVQICLLGMAAAIPNKFWLSLRLFLRLNMVL